MSVVTEIAMNTSVPFTDDPVVRELADCTPCVVLNPDEAANDRFAHSVDSKGDEAPEDSDSGRNPLWIVVAGIACLFGAMAAMMALS